MNTLIFAQTVFYLTSSLLIVVLLISAVMVSYYIVHIARNLNKLSNDLSQASEEVKENVKEIMERLSRLPFLSLLLKKSDTKTVLKKGRNK